MKFLFSIAVVLSLSVVSCQSEQCRYQRKVLKDDVERPIRRRPDYAFSGTHTSAGYLLERIRYSRTVEKWAFKPEVGDLYLTVDGCDLRTLREQDNFNRLEAYWAEPEEVGLHSVKFVREGVWYEWTDGELRVIRAESAHRFYQKTPAPSWAHGVWISYPRTLYVHNAGSLTSITLVTESGYEVDQVVSFQCKGFRCTGADYSGLRVIEIRRMDDSRSIEVVDFGNQDLSRYKGVYTMPPPAN